MKITLGLLAPVFLAAAVGEPAAAALELHRAAVLRDGEVWRLATGHFVHAGAGHLAWDAAAFALLAGVLERWGARRLLWTLALAGALVSAAVLGLRPDLAVYRGLSGLDAALFVAVIVTAWRRGHLGGGVAAALAAGFAIKLGWEFAAAGGAVFAPLPEGWSAVPEAHAAGALAGLLASLLNGLGGRRRRSPSPPCLPPPGGRRGPRGFWGENAHGPRRGQARAGGTSPPPPERSQPARWFKRPTEKPALRSEAAVSVLGSGGSVA